MVFWRFRIGDDFDFLGCLLGWLGCNVCWYLQIRTIPLLWPQLTGFWSPVWRGWYRPTSLQKINQRQVCMKLFKQNMLQTMKMIQDIFKMHAFSRSHSHTAFATLGEVSFGDVWNRFRSASFLHCSKFPINRLQLFFTLGVLLGKRQRSSKRTHLSISFGPSQYQITKQKMIQNMSHIWDFNSRHCGMIAPATRPLGWRRYEALMIQTRARVCVWLWLCGKNQ